MNLPGAPSLIFLLYIVAFLPWVAFRSARRLRQIESSRQPAAPRQGIWVGTILGQAVLLILAWLVGRGFGYRIFDVQPLEARHLLAAIAALAIFGVALVMHALVAFTGTLVFAMIVHAVYDFVAGYSISRTAREHDRSTALAP